MRFQIRCSEQWKDRQSLPEHGYGSDLATRTGDPEEYPLRFPKPIPNVPIHGLRLCFRTAELLLSAPPLEAALPLLDPALLIRDGVLVPRPVHWRTALAVANNATVEITACRALSRRP